MDEKACGYKCTGKFSRLSIQAILSRVGKKTTYHVINVPLLQTELCVLGDWLEIPSSNITLQEKLGEGAFGEVYKGLVGIDGKSRQCAVKKLKGKGVPAYILWSVWCVGKFDGCAVADVCKAWLSYYSKDAHFLRASL